MLVLNDHWNACRRMQPTSRCGGCRYKPPPPPPFPPPSLLPSQMPFPAARHLLHGRRLRLPNDKGDVPRSAAPSSSTHAPSSLRCLSMLCGCVPFRRMEIPRYRRQVRDTSTAGSVARSNTHCCGVLQVSKQPQGSYSVRGHFLRVAPVFAWPPLAWLLHSVVMWLTGWKARRDGARLAAVQARMQKMLADLKVTAWHAYCSFKD